MSNKKNIVLLIFLPLIVAFIKGNGLDINKFVKSHWYSDDVFDLYIENKNTVNILYTPICMMSYTIKKDGTLYKLYYNGKIDCSLNKCFVNYKINSREVFATMKFENDTTLKIQYLNQGYVKHVRSVFKNENFFPNYFRLKRQ